MLSTVRSVGVTKFTDWRAHAMQEEGKDRWIQLCEQIAVEQDSGRMIEMLEELNRMLDERDKKPLDREQSKRGAALNEPVVGER
jgi:hypothetical protein